MQTKRKVMEKNKKVFKTLEHTLKSGAYNNKNVKFLALKNKINSIRITSFIF